MATNNIKTEKTVLPDGTEVVTLVKGKGESGQSAVKASATEDKE